MLKVERATVFDIPAWLDLASEVGPLFGADMAHDVAFRDWLNRSIERGSAYCVRISGRVVGAMQFQDCWIHWLAVRQQARHLGIGRALVAFAQASGVVEIRVITFGQGHPHPDPASASAFYRRLGFQPSYEIPKPAPDNTPRELLVWLGNLT